jgi:ABC-2 type transport system ATP-binding protein
MSTPHPAAVLSNVTHRYGSIVALANVSMTLEAGQVTAVLGPNGAGKTTVVKLLTGLARCSEGRALLMGGDPQSLEARRRTGVMLQVARVPETLKVREHLHLFSSYYPRPLPLAQVLEITGLADVADRRYGALSGGQKQRVQFALAICGNPALLFLDEPTVGMDVESRRQFWGVIRTLASAGRSMLLTTHYLEEADALADRVIVLSRGRVIADGTTSQVKQSAAGRQVLCVTALDAAALAALPGVQRVSTDGGRTLLLTSDGDATLRALLVADSRARDIEVRHAGLEEAFLALTAADVDAAVA